MSHTLIPAPPAAQHRELGRAAALAAVDASRDAAALVWDLTMHQLYRAFAECLPRSDPHGGSPRPRSGSTAGAPMAGVRLAATRHAVNDIQDALRRMADGSYGACQQCARPIAPERLQAAPTTRWCPTCGADRR